MSVLIKNKKKLKLKFKNGETDMVTMFELLDHPFTEKEVNEIFKKLKKKKKSAADDRIRNEMIKFCTSTVHIFKSLVLFFKIFF